MLYPYRVYGDSSDEVSSVVRSIAQNNVADPLNVVPSFIDWSAEGYATDGEPLDGSPTIAFPNGRASLLYYQWVGTPPNYLNVYIAGAATLANGIPFRFSSAQHGAAILTRSVPRAPNTLTECSIIFERPDGSQVVVERYQQSLT